MAAPLLDERPAYGNLPTWVAHGLPDANVWLPQTQVVNGAPLNKFETPMFPPIYAGRTTKDTTPRLLEPRMRAQTLKSRSLDAGYPWATDVKPEFRQWSAYTTNNKSMDGPMQGHSRYSTSSWRRNLYNSHAKQGFKFWMEEKKPFSKSSKYTFGAYRTFLGLGNAPRN